MSAKPNMQQNEPIAIVGMGCRFPGGSNKPSKLWDLLEKPRDVAQEVPNDRFNLGRFYHKDGPHHGTTNTRMSYFLEEDIALFDTKFFAIPPGEAEVIDPQHRLLLEVVYEAVERAGFSLHSLSGSNTGVYVGVMCVASHIFVSIANSESSFRCQDYFALQAQDVNSVPTYAATGIAASNASSRISYFFNWHGVCPMCPSCCLSATNSKFRY
jgi:acyl transferase domain-containing protein